MSSNQIKIETFDKYIMRGGDQSLSNIEDLCSYGFILMGVEFTIQDTSEVMEEVDV